MAGMQPPANSGSCGDDRYAMYDEKKRKRMISNRDSARRSREKKQKHMKEINDQILQLENENNFYSERINVTMQAYAALASENDVLRAQIAEMTAHLRSLNSMIEILALGKGIAVDVPEIPDPSLEPWQLLCPFQPVPVSAHLPPF